METTKSIIQPEDQIRIDKAVKLGAQKQVQLVRFIYEELGAEGIKRFSETVLKPWARQWADDIRKRHGLKKEQITAKIAIQQLYPEVHDHTAICSDHLDMFFSVDHDDLQICGARYCPVAYQWMMEWPEGAHLLCYLYSSAFDEAFFEALNPDLVFTKHAECCLEQPGIPHGQRCLMQLETKNKSVDPNDIVIIENPDEIEVAEKIKELLAGKTIAYVPHIEK